MMREEAGVRYQCQFRIESGPAPLSNCTALSSMKSPLLFRARGWA